jgi:toxin ParE1/3/4
MKLRLSLDAEADLQHIRDTIIAENPKAAERVQKSIARAIELLKYFPNIGRPGSAKGTREKPVKSFPYVIVYTVEGGELIILRIYHGAQSRP